MKTCKTCKYWGKIEEDIRGCLGKVCGYVEMEWYCVNWNENSEWVLTNKYKNQKAFVKDGSDYYAELRTLPDFGCNQYIES